MPDSTQSTAPAAWLLGPPSAGDPTDARVEIWGLSPGERLRRALHNAGCARVEQADVDGASPYITSIQPTARQKPNRLSHR